MLHDSSRDYTYFRLDSQTGSIYTASVFDREKKVSYLLEVKSVDGSESARPGKHGKPNSGKRQMSVTGMILPGFISENRSLKCKIRYSLPFFQVYL